jgi:IclR family transcriptional regulator, pca regulon regulatory protein
MLAPTAPKPAAAEKEEREYVMGLEKGLSIIEAFGIARGPLTLTQVAEITGHTKASARRCLLTLCRLGYAVQAGRHFELAPRALRLGHAYVAADPLTKIAQPILDRTSERTHESASIAVLDAQDAVFVARSTHRRSLSFGLGVGARLPAYCSATGRVLLSELPDEHLSFLLNRMARPALTPQTQTDVAAILREVALARSQGYSVNDQELEIGLRSIAVPIRNGRGRLLAALSLSVATGRMNRNDLVERLLPELETARRSFAALL